MTAPSLAYWTYYVTDGEPRKSPSDGGAVLQRHSIKRTFETVGHGLVTNQLAPNSDDRWRTKAMLQMELWKNFDAGLESRLEGPGAHARGWLSDVGGKRRVLA